MKKETESIYNFNALEFDFYHVLNALCHCGS